MPSEGGERGGIVDTTVSSCSVQPKITFRWLPDPERLLLYRLPSSKMLQTPLKSDSDTIRMSSRTKHRRQHFFPFEKLPADVQLHILSNLDLCTLKNVTQATPIAREMYLEYPSSVLQGATSMMGLQIRNLLLSTHSLIAVIKSVDIYVQPTLDDMETFFEENLDTETPVKIELLDYDPLGVLHTLCAIELEVATLVHDYANDIYKNACNRDNPGAIPPPLELSRSELDRMMRACYRLKFFGVLFYNYADRFRVDLDASCAKFFNRLRPFEIDELVSIYQFALRKRRYFKSSYVHVGCSYSSSKPWTNIDPFNCETCRGLYTMHMSEANADSRPWMRSAQPFWYTVSDQFLDHQLCARFELCRSSPIKSWPDMLEANEPSAGWSKWREYYERSGPAVSREVYVNSFRILGHCFWDSTRLKRWGDMFGEQWLREETD